MGFNIQPVVNGIIQSTQTTNFPLYSNIQILSIALCYQPKRSELFWGSFSCHMAPVHEHSIEWPPSRSGWSLWEWAGAHTTKTLHKVRAVSMPHEAADPRNLSLALPPLSAPLAGVCSLEGTLLIGHFLLTGAVRRGETSVGVAVT